MRKLFREPLVHFLILGALLFVVWRATASRADSGSDEIVITAARIQQLSSGFRMTWQRPPTETEFAGLIQDHLREEIYYREALALGFDRDDQVIRRRLRQKMQFLTEDVASAVEPTRAELQAFLDSSDAEKRQVPGELQRRAGGAGQIGAKAVGEPAGPRADQEGHDGHHRQKKTGVPGPELEAGDQQQRQDEEIDREAGEEGEEGEGVEGEESAEGEEGTEGEESEGGEDESKEG